jgi:cytoskeletal protein RodZ
MPAINNNREGRKRLFVWSNSGSVAYIFIIIVASLLAGESTVFLGPSSLMMATTTAVAQEEENIGTKDNATTAEATTGGDTNATAVTTTTPSSSSGIHLSSKPVWEEQSRQTGVAPFNQTHSIITFFGNATLTVPDTRRTINVTDNGTAISSSVAGTTYGRAGVFSEEDGDTTAITFYEIMKSDPATTQTRGITIAVFDSNATGSLAPFNGMIVAGLHNEQSILGPPTITLWKWDEGISNSSLGAPVAPRQQEPLMNTTRTTSELQ